MDTFWGVVVANFATTTVDGELEQESNLQILKKCSSGRQKSYANKKATRLSGLEFTMVEPQKIFANPTIAANGREIKVSTNWFCIITLFSSKKS